MSSSKEFYCSAFFVLAQELEPDKSAMDKARREYETYEVQIQLEFDTARKLMADHPTDSHHHATIYERLLPGLDEIAAHYRAFQEEAEVLTLEHFRIDYAHSLYV